MNNYHDLCQSIIDTLKSQRNGKIKNGFYWENQIAFVYNSEKIEGNPLSKEQTRTIFETHTFRPESTEAIKLDYIQETSNHFRMFDLMLNTIEDDLTEDLICSFHKTLKRGTTEDLNNSQISVSSYKLLPNAVGDIITSSPENVQQDIQRLLNNYNNRNQTTYREVTGFHAMFESIHPFQDGNGRVGRMIMFRECLKNDLVPFIVLDENKIQYYKALQIFDGGSNVNFFIDYAKDMADLYLKDFSNLMPKETMLLLPNYEKFQKQATLNTENFFTTQSCQEQKIKKRQVLPPNENIAQVNAKADAHNAQLSNTSHIKHHR